MDDSDKTLDLLEKVKSKTQAADTQESFAEQYLWALANYLEASQGVFYRAVQKEDVVCFQSIATYAHLLAGKNNIEYGLGEGLPGQVAKDQKILNINNVPQGYVTIISGLGQASPTALLIVPLVKDNQTIAIFELASFHSFSDATVEAINYTIEYCITKLTSLTTSDKNKKMENKKEEKVIEQLVSSGSLVEHELEFVSDFRIRMNQNKFMLCYKGLFSQQMTKAILMATEKKVEYDRTEATLKKKVFNVMVECLQNISKHKDSSEVVDKGALFMIGKVDDAYVMYSNNIVANEKIDDLKNKLLAINTMNKEELKELYKSMIVSNPLSDQSGAGLGLIDIARKSGNKLDFDFKKIDTAHSFFSLSTKISL